MLDFNLESYLKIKIALLNCMLNPSASKRQEIKQAKLQLAQVKDI